MSEEIPIPTLNPRERAKAACDIVEPAVNALLNQGTVAKRNTLAVVILEPETGHAIYERRFGTMDPKDWERDYSKIARSKAEVAWRTKMDSGLVTARFPHLLRLGDAKYRGGVFAHGIAIGTSGVQSYWDEMFARWIADAYAALALRQFEEVALADKEHDFI